MLRLIGSVSLFLFSACLAFSQPAAAPPAFDVASVKVDTAGTNEGMGRGGMGRGREIVTPSPAGITMINVRLKTVIEWAYHVQEVQVSGPGWLDVDRYDVVAKAAGATPEDQLRLMMQTLLAGRFKLAFHRESKEMQAYVITVAKTGLKIKESTTEGDMDMQPSGRAGATIQRATVPKLADLLSGPLQAPVVDQTGLTGRYDFHLDLSNFLDPTTPMGINDVIPIFIQAAQQQLGVKIDERKMPVEMLMVDHAEKIPVEN
ncbi:MAG: TIGR03435 family protein [Bryobacteraceae bacterium]